jgi:acyl-CoA thioester hydrolase
MNPLDWQSDPEAAFSDVFSVEIAARDAEIDELGHVSNVVYVRWLQDVATAHSSAVGWTHDRYKAIGAVFVVHRHVIEYRAPAYAGDGIRLVTWVDGWSAATSTRQTRVVRVADGKELVRAVTTWALVTTEGGRPRRIPQEIVTAFRRKP